jgi:hypothetical protein
MSGVVKMEKYCLDSKERKVFCPKPEVWKKVSKGEVCQFCEKYIKETTGCELKRRPGY